ncbi:MAG TPA: metalloregulator ArsR/SmtB family transcription factor [Tepidisphaeraceae bacterium]|jgi:ArsR family transcriptional regulator|nr:metalloregulator ArsR/SmtB family transcription factor [Tepidisphaeraceae bacterium]
MDQAIPTHVQPDALLAWMECLADPTRLRLLRLLERNELGVAELCDCLQLPQSTVSRHLKVLSDQGWSRNRRQGTNNLYRMVLDELEPPARKLWLVAREQTAAWATASQDELRLRQLLLEKETDSQAFFASAAAKWDKLRDELYGRGFTMSAMLALLPTDWTVADLACGTGQATAELARCVKQVIAVDNSAAMLKAARKRTAEYSNVDLRRGDLEDLPIESQTCDAALLLLALTYVPDPAAVVSEMHRILKPGGRAAIVDLLPHDREDFRVEMGQTRRGIGPTELEQLLREATFVDTSAKALPPETNVKGPSLFLACASK